MPQKITLTFRPVAGFEMPYSEGYQLYSALLRIMQESDSAIAKHTHDSPISSISLGPLEAASAALIGPCTRPSMQGRGMNWWWG